MHHYEQQGYDKPLITLLAFSTVGFYMPIGESYIKAFVILFLTCLFINSIQHRDRNLREPKGYNIFFCLTLLISLSILPAYFYWNQGLLASIISTSPYMIYGLYLLLYRSKLSKAYLHKLLIALACISIILLLIKLIIPSLPIGKVINDIERGDRISIPGSIFIWYLYFVILEKLLSNRSKRGLLILAFAVCVFCIYIQKGRSQLFAIAALSVVFWLRHSRGNKIILAFFIIISSVIIINSPIVKELSSITQKQMDSTNPDQHVREIGIYYYFCEFPVKGINYLIGNGIPSYGRSSYGIQAEQFAEETKIHLVDIGLAGIYNYWGLFGLILYIYIFYHFIIQNRRQENSPARYFLSILFAQSILSAVPLYLSSICAIGISCFLASKPILQLNESNYIPTEKT